MIEHQKIGGYPWALEALHSLRVRTTGSNNGPAMSAFSTKQTYRHVRYLSAFGGKADNTIKRSSALWLLRERPMPSHKFHIGESVMLRAAVSRNVPGGVYEVTKQLPHNGLEFEYRIKSANEPYERIAGESELVKP